jgi:hypothetical protein
MASIEVDVAALSTLARRCEHQASRLDRMTVPPTQGDQMQPSALAISVASADIAAACARFAARMHDTAAALSTAAWGYAATEDSATNALSTVAA